MCLLRVSAVWFALSSVAMDGLSPRAFADDGAVAQPAGQDAAQPVGAAVAGSSVRASSQEIVVGKQYLRRHVDPFFRQPLVSSIPSAERLGDSALQPRGASDDSNRFLDNGFVLDYRFDHPARFPLPSWGPYHEYLERPGVLIYEGMRLAIRPDGRYQVRFTIGTPAVPVTLQIQFELADHCTNQTYTLTLPPITIPSETKPRSTTAGQLPKAVFEDLQTIHHEGYLPIFDGYPASESVQVVRRTGTARFGYGVRVP